MAGAPATVPLPLHADLCLVAQPDGVMVWDHYPASDPAWQLLEYQGADRQNRALHRQLQQGLSSFLLDYDRRLDPGKAPAPLLADFWKLILAESCIRASKTNQALLRAWLSWRIAIHGPLWPAHSRAAIERASKPATSSSWLSLVNFNRESVLVTG